MDPKVFRDVPSINCPKMLKQVEVVGANEVLCLKPRFTHDVDPCEPHIKKTAGIPV